MSVPQSIINTCQTPNEKLTFSFLIKDTQLHIKTHFQLIRVSTTKDSKLAIKTTWPELQSNYFDITD